MKRYMFLFALTIMTVQFTFAQDLNQLMNELSKIEGAQHQVVDKEMLNTTMNAVMEADSTGQLKSKMPAFMQKLESIEVVAIEEYAPEVKEQFLNQINSFSDGNGYETLMFVKEEDDNVRIISYKDGDQILGVFILVLDEEDAVIVKMSGSLSESDLTDIINEQKKNNN
ncbi:MAG: DUF4252 domain-containing protein [Dysgonomonas sp.]